MRSLRLVQVFGSNLSSTQLIPEVRVHKYINYYVGPKHTSWFKFVVYNSVLQWGETMPEMLSEILAARLQLATPIPQHS